MLKEDIGKILGIAINAPSGSNSQPWEFKVTKDQIKVYALPEKDHPILNYHNRGTWIAHGALIENIKIAATHFGYTADIVVFPDKQNQNITAKINLRKSDSIDSNLFDAIAKRTTNRKPYKKTPLTSSQREKIIAISKSFGDDINLKITENQEEIKLLGKAVSMNEVVMLENKELHKLFFEELVWSKEEEAEKKSGLFLKTMELALPQEKALKIFKNWKVMNFLNQIGIAKGIAKGNAKNYAATPLMGAIVVRDRDEDFLAAGRLMERLWLEATNMKLSFHLLTGVVFLRQRVHANNDKIFSAKHSILIENAYQVIANTFKIQNGVIALLFRMGDGGEPTAKSIKVLPEIIFNSE